MILSRRISVFSSGATIPELRLHYRTLGTYSETASGSNAVLLLHGTVGGGRQFTEPRFADPLFGPGKPLDASRFFIIIPDAIGHEQSSKPSDGLGTRFPPYNYHDLVRGQHVVVTKALGVNRLRLVVGTSMSGMLTWLWGTLFPTLKDGLLPVASLPESVRDGIFYGAGC